MNFTVDPPVLHSAATKFRDLAQQYNEVYNSLINAASTMGAAWDAADNQAFVTQINGFCKELQDMVNHLEQSAQTLDQQATNYETTCENNTSGAQKLAN